MIAKIKKKIRKEDFLTSKLSILINPYYIIRNGLYRNIKLLSSQISGDVLDFGCGTKPYEPLFKKSRSYIGIDMLNTGGDHINCKADIFYDGKKLPFNNAQFDSIVSFEVLEHVFNIDEILSELNRILKPGGKILITTPFAWDEHMIPYDCARYTSFGIRYLLEKHGFTIETTQKTTTTVLATCQIFIAYLYQYVFPRSKYTKRLLQLLVIFPLTSLSLLLDTVFPKRFEYYCNIITLAKRT